MVRQAHPGPDEPPYRTFNQKFRDAESYAHEERLPWTLLVDDLPGTVHHAYGPMSDPSFLIGADGRVSFYEKWTSPVGLHKAITQLLEQGGVGVVGSGIRRRMQLGPSMTDGWRAIRRGLPQSARDLNRAAPLSTPMLKVGARLHPVIAPVTLRSRPLAASTKVAIGTGMLVTGLLGAWLWSRAQMRA